MTEVSLKEHIIEIISHSGYGVKIFEDVDKAARMIGVLPETLIEAQARRKERVVDAGVERKIGKRNSSYQYYTINVTFSVQARVDFREYCEKRRIAPATMIRSAIHQYLQGTYEPEIRGKHFPSYTGGKKNSKPGGTIKSNITHGAKLAFNSRATAQRVSSNNLVRALLQEVMEGKFCRPGTFKIVGRSQMFADASQYYVPDVPGVTKSIRFAGQERREDLVERLVGTAQFLEEKPR